MHIFHATNLTTQHKDCPPPPPATSQLITISTGPTPWLQVGRGPLVVSRNGHLLPPGGWLYPCRQLMVAFGLIAKTMEEEEEVIVLTITGLSI